MTEESVPEEFQCTESDLDRLNEIEHKSNLSDNEVFLLGVVNKMFFRMAMLSDDVDAYRKMIKKCGEA